jgi:hypothetical protein
MIPQPLDEKPNSIGDTIKTTAKSMGQRLGHGAVAAAGGLVGAGSGSRGRLSVRIVADRMMKQWLAFRGAVKKPATRDLLYHFAQKQYNGVIDEAKMREIIGLPAGSPADPNAPANQSADPNAQPNAQSANPHDQDTETEINSLYNTIFALLKRRKQQSQQSQPQGSANAQPT